MFSLVRKRIVLYFSEVCKHEWDVRATSSLLMFSKSPLLTTACTAH